MIPGIHKGVNRAADLNAAIHQVNVLTAQLAAIRQQLAESLAIGPTFLAELTAETATPGVYDFAELYLDAAGDWQQTPDGRGTRGGETAEEVNATSGLAGTSVLIRQITADDSIERYAFVAGGGSAASSTEFSAKIISADGDEVYTVREQAITGQGAFVDKTGTSNISARNLAELSLGSGGGVGVGEIVLIYTLQDTDEPPSTVYVFSCPVYAKYLD